MYKKNRNKQFSLTDFNQPMGLKLNPENKWIKKVEMIPWSRIEDKYAFIILQSLLEIYSVLILKPHKTLVFKGFKSVAYTSTSHCIVRVETSFIS
jgi:hypothetical protein